MDKCMDELLGRVGGWVGVVQMDELGGWVCICMLDVWVHDKWYINIFDKALNDIIPCLLQGV